MKTELTIEQSQHLFDLGVPKEKASKVAWETTRDVKGELIPKNERRRGVMDKPFSLMHVGMQSFSNDDIFTLTDLLETLPKEFIPNKDNEYDVLLDIQLLNDSCVVSYEYKQLFQTFECKIAKELIDALYELTVWCIENGHLKFD